MCKIIPQLEWLENPEIFAVNRMEAHSDHKFYRSVEELKNNNLN